MPTGGLTSTASATIMSTVKILDINPGSDGDGRKWPKHSYKHNDEHYKERIATNYWIKDLPGGPDDNVVYRLNKLPAGYGGFEKLRPDGKTIDYFLYGHPNGRFDSLKKFYPHFKHLMDYGDSHGCPCDLCAGGPAAKRAGGGVAAGSRNESERSSSPPRQSQYFAGQNQPTAGATNSISAFQSKGRGRPPKHAPAPEPGVRKRFDAEGTPDVYETMITKLKEAEPGQTIDMLIEEHMSPDWRSGISMTKDLFKDWQQLPHYVPRLGETVLFIRTNDSDDTSTAGKQLDERKWEAGVITQMPKESISEEDLFSDVGKEQGVNYSGFRVEPLSDPGTDNKPYASQHKYVPLHLIRPFVFWRDCLKDLPETDWHPTIWHALTVMSSLCVVGRYRFRGVWPNATVFCQGVYIGSELITVGDVVSLLPRPHEQTGGVVTDVMEVTAIRLRFVNLDLEDDDMWPDPAVPYQTSLHISGRVYTLDPSRSFDGVGSSPIDPTLNITLSRLSESGLWYHYSDPSKSTVRIEVPYTRILSRCFDSAASGKRSTPATLSKAKEREFDISTGLKGLVDARQYSQEHDKRIKREEGRSWFWADTRTEQLDLHEVNGRFVGEKRERAPQDLRKWRAALKALDGKKGAVEALQAAKKEEEKVERKSSRFTSSAYSMVAASRQHATESPVTTDAENLGTGSQDEMEEDEDEDHEDQDSDEDQNDEFHDAMEVDEDDADVPVAIRKEMARPSQTQQTPRPKPQEVISLIDSDDEEDRTTNQLAEELAKKIRTNDPRQR